MRDRPKVGVLIPAAGRGLRMGGPRKQFRELGGSSVLHQTLQLFEAHSGVDSIVVAAPSEETDVAADDHLAGITKLCDVVPGGPTRQASVAAALDALSPSIDIVLVHDAVRPFVPAQRITAVIEAVGEFGAAALAVPLSDTLREGADGCFGPTLPRSGLYRMQTPQGCRRDWFEEAHRRAREGGYVETDDVAVVMRAGHPVHIVEGSSTNIKITTPEDWELARAMWESIRAEVS